MLLIWGLSQDLADVGDSDVMGSFPGLGFRQVFQATVDEVEQSAHFNSTHGGLYLCKHFLKLLLLQVVRLFCLLLQGELIGKLN